MMRVLGYRDIGNHYVHYDARDPFGTLLCPGEKHPLGRPGNSTIMPRKTVAQKLTHRGGINHLTMPTTSNEFHIAQHCR